jgi:hypothetical protein
MLCHWVHGYMVPNISKEHTVFIFKATRSGNYMDCLCLEDKSDTFLQIAGNCLPSDTASHPRRPESSLLNTWQINSQCVGHHKNGISGYHHNVPTVRALCRMINNQHFTIQVKAPDSRSSYISEVMPNIAIVTAVHQFMYYLKNKIHKIHIKDVKIISIYRTSILSDNCHQTLPISSPNL